MEPAEQAYPALHAPLHVVDVKPGIAPYCPAGHDPLHCAVVIPATDPYRPVLQLLQAPAPDNEYCPAGHRVTVLFCDPAGHAYPALHGPLHDDTVNPLIAPYLPASHKPVHDALVTPLASPYRPTLQLVHVPAAPKLYVPFAQATGVVVPDGHTYPAGHAPLHDDTLSPGVEPK